MTGLRAALAALMLIAMPAAAADPMPWWQDAHVYQIYPRSFADSDGDGIGDLNGITAHLDYLRDLGIDTVWLSPHFASPNVDNGYDISDYRAVMREFGTMADFDRMLAGMKARGIRLIIDLVVNHSSDRHAWFHDPAKRDYYIWRAGKDNGPPNNWPAFFGGSAWTRSGEDWYLHYFAPEQPDLNWDNPRLRGEIYDIMRFWLDKGVSGFRMDVIPFISKDPAFPDLTPAQLRAPEFVYSDGPKVHEYLQEMRREVLSKYDTMTVGEAWGVTPERAQDFVDSRRGELDMVFQFDAANLGRDGWKPKPWTVPELKAALVRIDAAAGAHGWAANFLGNHDSPRVVSRLGDGSPASAKALATLLLGQRGTPFIYQGDELGMANFPFTRIEQFRDISARNLNARLVATGKVPEATLIAGLARTSRDHGRTPIQWTAGAGAGFTTGTPWIAVNPDHARVNAAAEAVDPHSVLAHYRNLLRLRRADPVLRRGSYSDLDPGHPQVVAVLRELGGERRLVLINLSPRPADYRLPPWRAILSDTGGAALRDGPVTLEPWRAIILTPTAAR